jgi:hypothetical protein
MSFFFTAEGRFQTPPSPRPLSPSPLTLSHQKTCVCAMSLATVVHVSKNNFHVFLRTVWSLVTGTADLRGLDYASVRLMCWCARGRRSGCHRSSRFLAGPAWCCPYWNTNSSAEMWTSHGNDYKHSYVPRYETAQSATSLHMFQRNEMLLYSRFEGEPSNLMVCSMLLWDPEDGGSTFLWNISELLPD